MKEPIYSCIWCNIYSLLSQLSTYFTPLLATASLKLISSLGAVLPFPYSHYVRLYPSRNKPTVCRYLTHVGPVANSGLGTLIGCPAGDDNETHVGRHVVRRWRNSLPWNRKLEGTVVDRREQMWPSGIIVLLQMSRREFTSLSWSSCLPVCVEYGVSCDVTCGGTKRWCEDQHSLAARL
jgi:hypothetical protein